MPMQDGYKASVTTHEEQITPTYYSGLSSYHPSRSVKFLHGYKSLVVELLTHQQLE